MAIFNYIVQKNGKLERNKIEASSFDEAEEILESRHLKVVTLSAERKETSKGFLARILKRKISIQEKINLTEHLSIMLKAGVPIFEAVEVLSSDVKDYSLSQTLIGLRETLKKGGTMSSFLEDKFLFSEAHLAMIRAGEISGNLEVSLGRISEDLKKEYDLRQKIKNALAYPTIVTITLIGIGGGIITFILPKIAVVFTKMEIDVPLPTKILLKLSQILNQYYLFVGIFLLVGFFLIFFLFKRSEKGGKILHFTIRQIPLIKDVITQIDLARFVRTLSSLLNAGVAIDKSLEVSGKVFAGKIHEGVVNDVVEKIKQGVSLTESFRAHPKIFPLILARITAVGEQSGALDRVLQDLATFYEKRVDDQLNNFASIIEPILMLLVGLGAATMILSIMGPIYQMIGTLANK